MIEKVRTEIKYPNQRNILRVVSHERTIEVETNFYLKINRRHLNWSLNELMIYFLHQNNSKKHNRQNKKKPSSRNQIIDQARKLLHRNPQ